MCENYYWPGEWLLLILIKLKQLLRCLGATLDDHSPYPLARRPDPPHQMRADHQAALDSGPGHHGRYARDPERLAVPLRQRARHCGTTDWRAGADGLCRDGQAVAAYQSRNP